MQRNIEIEKINNSVEELRGKTRTRYGWGFTKKILDKVDAKSSGDDKFIHAKAFLRYGDIKNHWHKTKSDNRYKGFVLLLADAFEVMLKDNHSIIYETIIEFIDENYENICKDGMWDAVQEILKEIACFLTENVVFKEGVPHKKFNIELLFDQYMSKIVISGNLKNIAIDWLKYLSRNDTLSNAVCFCEFISNLYLTPSFANEIESDYYYIKKILIDMGGKNNLLKSKISQIYLLQKEGLIPKEYYITLLQRLPEIDYWPLRNDHLSMTDYLKFPSTTRLGVNNQMRIKKV